MANAFHVNVACRGMGTAYFLVDGKFPDVPDNLVFTVYTEKGGIVPATAYELNHPEGQGGRIALAIPLLSSKGLTIEVTTKGSSRALVAKSFSWNQVKWLSRLHYKTQADLMSQIRDIDNYTYSRQIHVKAQIVVDAPSKAETIVKGCICMPENDSLPEISLIRGDASIVESPDIYIGRQTAVHAKGLRRKEIAFTLRIPQGGDTYCLVARSKSGNRSGFLCLDPASLDALRSTCSPLMYQSSSQANYSNSVWRHNRFLQNADSADYDFAGGPKFSIIVPLFKTPVAFFREMVDSVLAQVYSNWELILVNASPEDESLCVELAAITDSRITVVTLESNLGIAENTNAGLRLSSGDYVVFFDHDDTLDPFALLRYANAICEDRAIDALYCDEDFLNESGEYVAPHFKSDFNLDLLRVHNYITHLLCVKSCYAKRLELRREFDGAQDYDFLLRLVEETSSIKHIPGVLYHWRISDTSTAKSSGNKSYADEAGRKALQSHLDRCGLAGTVETTDAPCFYHIRYELQAEPLVSIVIPNKDSVSVLSRCIESIESKTSYKNFEILIIENNSTEKDTFDLYREIEGRYPNIKTIVWDGSFNYSAINNYGVKETKGEYLLFLNNDTEVIEPRWIDSMLSLCQREDVGAVGAKLLYPDNTVQHVGVMMIKCGNPGIMGGPVHVFNNIDRDDPGYMRRAAITQDLTAVTAACMMTKRALFDEIGGFNEDFEVAFNDVDYCLRLRRADKLVVFDADALLYHYESFSRGYESDEKMARFMAEQGRMRLCWPEYFACGDPYHGAMSTQLDADW